MNAQTMQASHAEQIGDKSTCLCLLQMKSDIDTDDLPMFYGCFKHLATKADMELRRNCAQQLPSVLKAAAAVQQHAFALHFVDMTYSLANDSDEEVRTLAGSIS